jgi:hypothetical protein
MFNTHKHDLTLTNKMKNRKYHIVGEFPKSDHKIAEGANVDTPNTQIHDYSLPGLETDTSTKCGGVKILPCTQTLPPFLLLK